MICSLISVSAIFKVSILRDLFYLTYISQQLDFFAVVWWYFRERILGWLFNWFISYYMRIANLFGRVNIAYLSIYLQLDILQMFMHHTNHLFVFIIDISLYVTTSQACNLVFYHRWWSAYWVEEKYNARPYRQEAHPSSACSGGLCT